MKKPGLYTRSRSPEFARALKVLQHRSVMVGIPSDSDKNPREDGKIENNRLGFIHEFGSPARNIPARPFLIPGVRGQQKLVASAFQKAAKAAIAGDVKTTEAVLEMLALVVPDKVRLYMTAGIPPPLKEASLRGRKYARETKSMRASEVEEINRRFKGQEPSALFEGIETNRLNVPLINTGQLRDSITGFVEKD